MTVLITGAGGFVGGHVVRSFLEHGYSVRAFVRPSSRTDHLTALDVPLVYGDLRDPSSLSSALCGCSVLVHVAADYRLWARRPSELYSSNVDGTRSLLRAALEAGVERVVYTSTVGTLGIPKDGKPGTEDTPVSLKDMVGHYKRSKFLAEEEVRRFYAEHRLPIVIVNPSTPVGEEDAKPSPTGKMIVDFLRGRMVAYIDTGLNLVDVRDVSEGHVLALERGIPGQRYILGNRNLTLRGIFHMLAAVTGLPAPKVRLPYWVAYAAGWVDTLVEGGLLGHEPSIPLEGVRMARKRMFFDASRAVRELGLPQSPVEEALARAVSWFRSRGYA
ncbi:MAG: hopanoid-associated sugar epimerase [Chthonomonadales bacterium]